VVICLERGADLHTAQLMPLPPTVSCFSKIQIGFAFLVPAHLGSPGKRAVKRVYVCHQMSHFKANTHTHPFGDVAPLNHIVLITCLYVGPPAMLSSGQQWAELGVNATVNCTVSSVSDWPAVIAWSQLSRPHVDDLNSLPR